MMKKSKIVVVDDDAVTCAVLSVLLNAQGFEVSTAKDAAAAFPLVRQEHPNLVILDVNMPGRDGLSVLWEFRHDPDLKDMPVLMLTNEAKFKAAALAFDLGASGYMTKPFTRESVQTKIAELLGERTAGA